MEYHDRENLRSHVIHFDESAGLSNDSRDLKFGLIRLLAELVVGYAMVWGYYRDRWYPHFFSQSAIIFVNIVIVSFWNLCSKTMLNSKHIVISSVAELRYTIAGSLFCVFLSFLIIRASNLCVPESGKIIFKHIFHPYVWTINYGLLQKALPYCT